MKKREVIAALVGLPIALVMTSLAWMFTSCGFGGLLLIMIGSYISGIAGYYYSSKRRCRIRGKKKVMITLDPDEWYSRYGKNVQNR